MVVARPPNESEIPGDAAGTSLSSSLLPLPSPETSKMRRRFLFPHLALLAVLVIAAGCRDTAPTATRLSRVTGLGSITLDDYIQQQINLRLPKGFEDVVDARWSTVKSKKNAGDFAGAEKHLNTLATWIAKKQNDIIPADGHTKAEDAALLVLNMRRWLYVGENASIVNPSGPDDVVRFVPAGTAATVVTPSTHAGVSFGPQNEDRVIVIAEEQYPGICNGPLPTARCQYPLFYQIESFPNTRLQGLGHFAVCMVTTGDRRPLEYLN